MNTLFWLGFGFFCGSLPFSVWLGRLALDTDIRRYGDGNPGATNAWRAGGWRIGLLALCLDYLKGLIPVGLAHFGAELSGWALVAAALAPMLGHAYSPWLRFRGGKALATTFGVWTGLTLWEGPTVLGLLLALSLFVQDSDGWAVVLGLSAFLGYLLLREADIYLLTVWAFTMLLLSWKYRSNLSSGSRLRPTILHLLRRKIG